MVGRGCTGGFTGCGNWAAGGAQQTSDGATMPRGAPHVDLCVVASPTPVLDSPRAL